MAVQRQTASVKAIWKQFESSPNAQSVVDLVKIFQSDMNKTTVYRILDRLEKEGKLHSFTGKDGLTWYAKCLDCSHDHHIHLHPHFQCKQCGTVECLDEEINISNLNQYQIEQAQVLLFGNCEQCQS